MKTIKSAGEIAQWVIDNRYPKEGKERMTDTEMFHLLEDMIYASQFKVELPTDGRNEFLSSFFDAVNDKYPDLTKEILESMDISPNC
jgi:hypothetical protein